jgi:hypothetical protein
MNNLVIAGLLVTLTVVVLASVCAFPFYNCDKKEKFSNPSILCGQDKVQTVTTYMNSKIFIKTLCVGLNQEIQIKQGPGGVKEILFDIAKLKPMPKNMTVVFYIKNSSDAMSRNIVTTNPINKVSFVGKSQYTHFRIYAT